MPKFTQSKNKKVLRFVPLGGAGHVNRNMFAYECGEDIVILDCGIGFPDFEMLGVDVTIPDISYLEEQGRKSKVRGIIITHAHYDHFGALPYILPHLPPVPIYGSRLTLEFVKLALAEARLIEHRNLIKIAPGDRPFSLGCFEVNPFHVCHSVPESLGFALKTPVGTVFHVSDYKFDWMPEDGRTFDVGKVVSLVQERQPLALVSDCLGAATPGYTASERAIGDSLTQEMESAQGRQLFVVTISSNISRIGQVVEASLELGRKICFLGRSMEQSSRIAEELGYLKIARRDFVEPERARGFDQSQLTYIAAGCYGQPDSAIAKVARNDHPLVRLGEGAKVIFSGDPSPPGARDAVDLVIDKLILNGAQVSYYEIQENMHVSGHGSAGDIQMLMGLVKPEFFVPIGGTPKHMRAYSLLAQKMGNPSESVFELQVGEFLEFFERRVQKGKFSFKDVLVDGIRAGDVGKTVLEERRILADDGIVVLIVPVNPQSGEISASIQVVTRGFVYVKASKELITELEHLASKTAQNSPARKRRDWEELKGQLEKSVSSYVRQKTGRSPIVLPVVVKT